MATMCISLTACTKPSVNPENLNTDVDMQEENNSISDTEEDMTTTEESKDYEVLFESIKDVMEDRLDSVEDKFESIENRLDSIEDSMVEKEPSIEDEDSESTEIVEQPSDEDAEKVQIDETISKVFDEVKNTLGENYFPNVEIMQEMYETVYGLNLAEVESVYGEMPMISANVDTLIGVLAKEDSLKTVKEALEKYVDTMKNDSFQYPANMAKMPAMEIVTHGNYVFLVATFGDVFAENDEPTDEQILEIAKKNVAKTKEIIEKCFK
jgi:hypothetical protein